MTASKIEWCDRSDWNPIRGCTRVSPGCGGPGPHGGCYAEAIAARFSDPGQAFHGFAERTKSGPRWTGKIALLEDRLALPLRWKKPARIFASSTSDIFHESLPDDAIDKIFAVMALCPQHTFQVLTKRAKRMREYIGPADMRMRMWEAGEALATAGLFDPDKADLRNLQFGEGVWPLPNCWLGVSVEDQDRADERIPELLDTPAAVRFLSCEPLLGPVDLTWLGHDGDGVIDALRGEDWIHYLGDVRRVVNRRAKLSWVIAGGESGTNARPMHPDWPRSLRDQCQAAGVPFFFKQWGEWAPYDRGRVDSATLATPGSTDQPIQRFGKKVAGRLMDGIEHSETPR